MHLELDAVGPQFVEEPVGILAQRKGFPETFAELLLRGVPCKAQEPAEKIGFHARPEAQRSGGLKHVSQRPLHNAGGGERDAQRGHYLPGVAQRGAPRSGHARLR